MVKVGQKGIAQILVLVILIGGLVVGLYLVRQTQIFKPKATSPPFTAGETSFTLSTNSTEVSVDQKFAVDLLVRTDTDAANLFVAKINFPKDLLEVSGIVTENGPHVTDDRNLEPPEFGGEFGGGGGTVCAQVITPAMNPSTKECKEFPTPCDVPEGWEKVVNCVQPEPTQKPIPTPTCQPRPPCLDTTPACLLPEPPGGWCPGSESFIKNWVEREFDNSEGTISIVGGVPTPGFQTETGADSAKMATIYFTAKAEGNAKISLTEESAIYRDSDNVNILQIKRDLMVNIVGAIPTEGPIPTCQPRPGCLDSTPRCLIPEPPGGWCPSPEPTPTPTPTCQPRPACLDTTPACLIPEPPGGWCSRPPFQKGDGNRDGKIDLIDLSVLLSNFNRGVSIPELDANGDGVINVFDFSALIKIFIANGIIKQVNQ